MQGHWQSWAQCKAGATLLESHLCPRRLFREGDPLPARLRPAVPGQPHATPNSAGKAPAGMGHTVLGATQGTVRKRQALRPLGFPPDFQDILAHWLALGSDLVVKGSKKLGKWLKRFNPQHRMVPQDHSGNTTHRQNKNKKKMLVNNVEEKGGIESDH